MNIKAHIVPFQQGTPEWVQHRSRSLNASELAVAMGISSNMQRNELIRCKATGIPFEHSDFVEKRVFAPGHEFEAIARPWAEEIIGEDLYCSVFAAEVDGLHVSASLDGHTLLNEVTMEHKQLNDALAASLDAGIIPDEFHPQMEQGFMLTGATRCLFMASKGDRETMRFCWYESNPELRAKIIPTWKQFMADVAAYVPTAAEPIKPVGRTPDQLPALRSSVKGELVLESNIKEWESAALAYIQAVRDHDLKTDQDFEDADAAVKWCVSSKTTLGGLKSNLMSATGDVNTAVGTLDRLMSELDKTRIQFTKAMDARKAERKAEIVAGGVAAYEKHEAELIRDTGGPWIVLGKPDFGSAIKNLRTFASIQNAVDTALAAAKIRADESARKIRESLRILAEDGAGYEFLFNDRLALIGKAPDDLRLLVKSRIAEHQAAEKAKEEAQRGRIRAEEAARLEREAEVARQVREAAEEIDREREKQEAYRLERERKEREPQHSAKVVEQLAAQNHVPIEFNELSQQGADALAYAIQSPEVHDTVYVSCRYRPISFGVDLASKPDIGTPEDNGTRLTLGQLNDRLAPVSINVAGLSSLGFDPVEQVKASRFYRECDLPAICKAISAHVLAACATEVAA